MDDLLVTVTTDERERDSDDRLPGSLGMAREESGLPTNIVRIAPTAMPARPMRACSPTIALAVAARVSAIAPHQARKDAGSQPNQVWTIRVRRRPRAVASRFLTIDSLEAALDGSLRSAAI